MEKITKSSQKKKAKIIYEGKPKQKGWMTITLIGLLIIIFALFFISNGTFFVLHTPLFTTNNSTQTQDNVLVTVNNQPIYTSQLDAQWNALPIQTKMTITRNDVLTKLVEEQLLLEEAAQNNISVSDEEVQTFISSQLNASGVTPEMFTKYLDAQGISRKEAERMYKQQLTVAKLFSQKIDQNTTVTPEEINTYYEENKEQFQQPDMVTIRHILLQVSDQFNETQAQQRVKEILSLLNDNFSNFCALVSNYSMDLGSSTNCGEYTFSKGQFNNPAFEDAAFNMSVGELRVVTTSLGLHIMLKMADYPAKQLTLTDKVLALPDKPLLQTLIQEDITAKKAQAIYTAYVDELKAKSDIVYAKGVLNQTNQTLTDNQTTNQTTEVENIST